LGGHGRCNSILSDQGAKSAKPGLEFRIFGCSVHGGGWQILQPTSQISGGGGISSGYLKSSWNGLRLGLGRFFAFLDFFSLKDAATGPNAAKNASNEMEIYFVLTMVGSPATNYGTKV